MLALLFALTPEAQACGMYYGGGKQVMAEITVSEGRAQEIDYGSLSDIFGIIDEEPETPAEAFDRLAPPVHNKAPEQPAKAPLS